MNYGMNFAVKKLRVNGEQCVQFALVWDVGVVRNGRLVRRRSRDLELHRTITSLCHEVSSPGLLLFW